MSYPPPPSGPEDPNAAQPPVYGQPSSYGQPPSGQQPYGQPGYYAPYAAPVASQKALWAMICGILGLLCCGILSIVAIVLGSQAKNEIAASSGTQTGEGQAQAGFILGIIGVALIVVILVGYVVVLAARNG